MGRGEDEVGAWPDKQLDMVWERFWSNPHGEEENLFSSCLPKHFPALAWCWGFGNEVWVEPHSQVMLAQHPSVQQ